MVTSLVPIIQRVGLGRGLSLWSGTGNVVGWLVGRFGIFGINPEQLKTPWLGIVGLIFSIVGLCVVATVKMSDSGSDDENGASNVAPLLDLDTSAAEAAVKSKDGEKARNIQGIVLAVIAGCLYGLMYVPMTIYLQMVPPDTDDTGGGESLSTVQYS